MSEKLSIDVLRLILENVDKADLVAVCQVNKVCCSCSQDFLYRNILVRVQKHGLNVCQTLAQSIYLAKRVRSFTLTSYRTIHSWESIAKALQNMSSLRSLTLGFLDQPFHNPRILGGCTFKLDSFYCHFTSVEILQFLNNQPSITHLALSKWIYNNEFEATCLPNLTQVCAGLSYVQKLIPGRPVSEVELVGHYQPSDSLDLGYFALSTAPIRKLNVPCTFIYPRPVQLLASIFPSLVHLVIHDVYSFNQVRVAFFSFSNHGMLSNYAIVWT
jgi:hypothetical protein